MRALHLLGLRGPGLLRLRFHPPTDEPLILPSWLAPTDRETLLAFYQQVLAEDEALLRVEVDWDFRIVPGDADYLRDVRLRHGAERDLIVVRVRRAGVDLEDIVATPELAAFQYVAIACDHPAINETVGRLREIAALVAQTAEDLYSELALEHGLRADGAALVEPLVRTLVNPIPILEAYNALIRLSVEPSAPGVSESRGGIGGDPYRDAIYRSVLGPLLDDLPSDELVGIAAIVLRGAPGLAAALGPQSADVESKLRARMVLVDQRLMRWARFLEEPALRDLVKDRVARRSAPTPRVPGLKNVRKWLSEGRPAARAGDPIRDDVLEVFAWISERKLARAADALASLERRLDEPDVTDETRGDFWDAVGRLRSTEGRWSEAEPAFRRSLSLLEKGGAGPVSRSITMSTLARELRDNGRWSEAEPLFRQALQLAEEGGETLTNRSIMMDGLARGLRNNGRWSEAEPLYRQVLRLKEERGDAPTSRGNTMSGLARGLLNNGRWSEAEPLFRKALQLKEEGGATPTSRAITMRAYAMGLRAAGRLDEASKLDEEAAKLESQK